MDDTFVAWKHGKDILDQLLNNLNVQHPGIQLTMETETNQKIESFVPRTKEISRFHHMLFFFHLFLNWSQTADIRSLWMNCCSNFYLKSNHLGTIGNFQFRLGHFTVTQKLPEFVHHYPCGTKPIYPCETALYWFFFWQGIHLSTASVIWFCGFTQKHLSG